MGSIRAPRQITQADQGRRVNQRLDPQHLVRLAQLLPALEREMIEARFGEGLTYPEMARRFRTDAGRLRRRVARIVERLASPEFRFIYIYQDKLPRPLRRPAVESRSKLDFVHGNWTACTRTAVESRSKLDFVHGYWTAYRRIG